MTFSWIVNPLVQLALRLHDRVLGPRIRVRVECTGGGQGVSFLARVDNTSVTQPALDCRVRADITGIGGVFQSAAFSLPAGTLGHEVRFDVERPRYADIVKALNNEPTLYGKTLVVQVDHAGRRKAAKYRWDEARYDRQTNGARYEVQQDVWRSGSGNAP